MFVYDKNKDTFLHGVYKSAVLFCVYTIINLLDGKVLSASPISDKWAVALAVQMQNKLQI